MRLELLIVSPSYFSEEMNLKKGKGLVALFIPYALGQNAKKMS